MKRLIMTCLVLFVANGAMAQLDFGPRVAFLSTSIKLDDPAAGIEEGDAQFGYQFGVFARVNLIGLYVQPEVLFTNSNSVVSALTQDVDLSFNKVDVPVMLGMKVGPVRIQAGPTLSFLTSAESKLPSGTVTDIKDQYNSTTWGYQAGVGLDVWKLIFDVKYEGNLSAFADAVPGGINTDQKQSQWVLGIGFKLF